MLKLIVYRLTLFVLLLSGLGQLFANLYFFADSEPATVCFRQNNESVNLVWFSKEKQSDRLSMLLFENEEKEDDELTQGKKHLEIANYAASILFTQTFNHFSDYYKKTLLFEKEFSYTSSCRYLSLQVFRI